MSDTAVLVCKVVPPGSETLPTPIHLVAGDTLSVHVSWTGRDETGRETFTQKWDSTFEAQMSMTIEFDYMEVKDPGPLEGVLFTELEHNESYGP